MAVKKGSLPMSMWCILREGIGVQLTALEAGGRGVVYFSPPLHFYYAIYLGGEK